MKKTPQHRSVTDTAYQSINPQEMILRDHLALDRTVLANDRTVLAYARTVIGLLGVGITLIKLFPDDIRMVVIGYSMFPIAIYVAFLGWKRFQFMHKVLNSILEAPLEKENMETYQQ